MTHDRIQRELLTRSAWTLVFIVALFFGQVYTLIQVQHNRAELAAAVAARREDHARQTEADRATHTILRSILQLLQLRAPMDRVGGGDE